MNLLSSPQSIVLTVGLLLFLSILASKLSDRFGVPALLMFLVVGMLAGSDGPGGIYFDSAAAANLVGTFALAYILFAGGMDTDWGVVQPVLWRGMILSTLGVVVTAALVGLFTWQVLGFPWQEGMLLGAIVSSTDAAAVFAVLRSRGVGLKGHIKPLLELESGSNDPMALFLTAAVIRLIATPAESPWALLPSLLVQMPSGIAVGLAIGWLAGRWFDRLRLEYEGLYPVLSMSLVLLAYGLSEALHGNGFLVPRGQTRVEAFDTLLMIAKPEELQAARERLLAPRLQPAPGPAGVAAADPPRPGPADSQCCTPDSPDRT